MFLKETLIVYELLHVIFPAYFKSFDRTTKDKNFRSPLLYSSDFRELRFKINARCKLGDFNVTH